MVDDAVALLTQALAELSAAGAGGLAHDVRAASQADSRAEAAAGIACEMLRLLRVGAERELALARQAQDVAPDAVHMAHCSAGRGMVGEACSICLGDLQVSLPRRDSVERGIHLLFHVFTSSVCL